MRLVSPKNPRNVSKLLRVVIFFIFLGPWRVINMTNFKEIRKITASNLFHIKTTPTAGIFILCVPSCHLASPHSPLSNELLLFFAASTAETWATMSSGLVVYCSSSVASLRISSVLFA